jgi:hypothetical protein
MKTVISSSAEGPEEEISIFQISKGPEKISISINKRT